MPKKKMSPKKKVPAGMHKMPSGKMMSDKAMKKKMKGKMPYK